MPPLDLQKMRESAHLSYSQISTYLQCSLKYYFAYILRVEPDFIPLALVFGSAIHATLAQYYQSVLEGNPMSTADLQEYFLRVWEVSYDENTNFGKSAPEEVEAEGRGMLAVFHETVKPGTVLAIEQPFQIPVEGCPPLIGAMDLIEMDRDGNTIIVDHKTSSSKYSQDKVQRDLQMSIYSLAASLNGYTYQDQSLRFDVLVKTKTPQFVQYPTTRQGADHQRAQSVIKAVWKAICAGCFIPNDTNNMCSSCQYQSSCQKWS